MTSILFNGGTLSENTAQNLVLIEALRKSRILSPEGKEILGKRIALASREAKEWRERAEKAEKGGFNRVSGVFSSLASQIEAHL